MNNLQATELLTLTPASLFSYQIIKGPLHVVFHCSNVMGFLNSEVYQGIPFIETLVMSWKGRVKPAYNYIFKKGDTFQFLKYLRNCSSKKPTLKQICTSRNDDRLCTQMI